MITHDAIILETMNVYEILAAYLGMASHHASFQNPSDVPLPP